MSYDQSVEMTFTHEDIKVIEKLQTVLESWADSTLVSNGSLRIGRFGSWVIDDKWRLSVQREEAPMMHDRLAEIGVTLHKDDEDHFYFTAKELSAAIPGLSIVQEYIGEEFMDADILNFKDGKVVKYQVPAWVETPFLER